MGCCVSHEGNLNDIPFEEIDEFRSLKQEINQILINKDNIDQTDNIQLLELINRISIKIAKCEEVIDRLKTKRKLNPKTIEENIKGLKSDINELKEYNISLNNQVKKNKSEIQLKEIIKEEPVEEENSKTENNILRGNNRNIESNSQVKKKNLKINDVDTIYFKKYIRRNKKSNIFNKTKSSQNNYAQTQIITCNFINNNNFYNNNNDYNDKESNYIFNCERNKINVIFILENGKKIPIEIERKDKFLEAITKLGQVEEEYNDVEKMMILDGDNDITNRVKNNDIISSFGINDYHYFQIKLISN